MKKRIWSLLISATLFCTYLPTSHAADIVMGGWDTNGDGSIETVYNSGFTITIKEANGKTRTYPLTQNWFFMGTGDTDGVPGTDLIFNVNGTLKIIHDASQTMSTYSLGGNWWLLNGGIADTDGIPGAELVFNVNGTLRFVHDNTKTMKDYNIGNNWILISGGITDLDGVAGSEIALNMGVVGGIKIFHENTGITNSYAMPANWTLAGIYNQDNVAGNEIIYSTSAGTFAINDRLKTNLGI
ncbi:hypothetical protein [Paenibacillus bovis]|uniref:Uncharacterized protein n=1 Tax=Paenibacillus bovis TaxID=1616788 RepID=A0A172ZHM4_9BACL|nr:hypothetical protein [Paenibacillus bovis]ANF97029.1 hypothetical protein AR543_14135 [Paenibacillus bovis]